MAADRRIQMRANWIQFNRAWRTNDAFTSVVSAFYKFSLLTFGAENSKVNGMCIVLLVRIRILYLLGDECGTSVSIVGALRKLPDDGNYKQPTVLYIIESARMAYAVVLAIQGLAAASRCESNLMK